eukprot:gnl/MRDRNA2_/MRDRNA2_119658_c0_seq1.p1 gnl/MRDRNA2_/MRDRNA2_119658_c0~~gnl/MRDRNA2_/MRDRNA2_119658_c0_seq1.p1  ORF type:complete len:239 (+),score=39.42 gnl/MRDRNA2_/MRDRNA2_119658_c0_seq1:94-810(+)
MFVARVLRCGHYATLGIPRSATQEQIRTEYLRLAKMHHPDKKVHAGATAVSSSTERFKQIQNAWEVLGAKDKRAEYDRTLPREGGPSKQHSQRRPHAGSAWDFSQKSSSSSNARSEEWHDAFKRQQQQKNTQSSKQRMQNEFRYGRVDPYEVQRQQMRQFEEVMAQMKSNPELSKFISAGMTVKLMAQCGMILACMLNLAMLAWLKAVSSRSSENRHKRGQADQVISGILSSLGLAKR